METFSPLWSILFSDQSVISLSSLPFLTLPPNPVKSPHPSSSLAPQTQSQTGPSAPPSQDKPELSAVLDSLNKLAELENRITHLEKDNQYDYLVGKENRGKNPNPQDEMFKKKRIPVPAQVAAMSLILVNTHSLYSFLLFLLCYFRLSRLPYQQCTSTFSPPPFTPHHHHLFPSPHPPIIIPRASEPRKHPWGSNIKCNKNLPQGT